MGTLKKNEETLTQSHNNSEYLRYLKELSCIIVTTDTEGNIMSVNDNFCKISKFTEEELLGQNIRIVNSRFHALVFFEELWNTISSGNVWKGEIKNKSKDGSFYWVETTIIPIKNEAEKCYQYTALQLDITARKIKEEKLLLRIKNKQNVLNEISDNIFLLDNEWRYTYLNDAAKEDQSIGFDEPIGKIIWEVHPELLGTKFESNYRIAMRNKVTIEFKEYSETQGNWYEVKVSPLADGLAVFFRNINSKKTIENNLFISEQRLSKAVKIGKIGYWQQDLNTGKVWATKETKKIYGFPEVDGELVYEIVEACIIDKEIIHQAIKDIIEKNLKYNIVYRIQPHNGESIKYIESAAELELDKDGNPWLLVGILRDITDRKLAEEKIQESEFKYSSLIEQASDAICIADSEFNFIDINPSGCSLLGYTKEEFIKLKAIDLLVEEELLVNPPKFAQIKSGITIRHERLFKRKDGTIIQVEVNGKMLKDGRFVLFAKDISERKLIENELINSEEKYRYLFHNNPATVIIWDLENLQILEVNEQSIALYGYTRDEFLKLRVLDIRPAADRNKIKKFSQEILNNNISNAKRTWRHLKKNGELMYMDITSHKIEFNNRKAILSLAIDITEQVKAENQLKDSYDDIRRLHSHLLTIREDERTSVAREIHDELGQQLTGLKMDASWLLKKATGIENDQKEKLSQMILLIDETVKTVRRISRDLRPGILDDLGLVAALEWQSCEFEKRTGVKCDFKAFISELTLNKNATIGIFRIYQESLTNIMRHANATLVNAYLKSHDNLIELSIQDNGVGFDKNLIKAKRTLGLTGLSERAIMLGGNLNIESEKGKGTRIVFEMPID